MTNKSKVSHRLEEGPAPEVVKYVYGDRNPLGNNTDFDAMTDINIAHIKMLQKQKILKKDVAGGLLNAIATIHNKGLEAHSFEPDREDLYFNYEYWVSEIASPEVGGQMHTGRSRNDLGSTMVRMRAREFSLELISEVLTLRKTIHSLAGTHINTPFPGYTHLQPAQPISFAHYLLGIEQSLSRDTGRLIDSYKRTNQSPLGAGALAGTGFPIDRMMTAELLGFDGVLDNTLDAVASRDYLLEILGDIVLLSVTLNRLTQDLYVWYTHEFGLVDFHDRVSGTSSIMPQKKNPVVLEYLKGKTAQPLGAYVSAAAGLRNSAFSNIIDANRIGFEPAWPVFEQCKINILLTKLMLENLIVRKNRAAQAIEMNFSTTTELADTLVRESGISFREAHEIVGGVVRSVVESGAAATEINGEMVRTYALKSLGISLEISDIAVSQALSVTRNLDARAHVGGPAPAATAETLQNAKRAVSLHEAKLVSFQERLKSAKSELYDGLPIKNKGE